LTPAAKRSLLDERSYRRVIDHRNYNPRTIEWITGLAGHRLTTEELGRYVDFAVDSLNHPEQIWRHAFEREIDDHGRMLLLALATLPNGTALTHLEQAFAAVCRVAGLSLGGRAFNRSLAALDDSFIRTAHDGGDGSQDKGIVVGPYDPSVVDFLRDYLRTSPGDASLLVQGAEFFEQVEWLYAALSAQGHPSRDVIDGLSDAAMRTFEAPGLRVIRVRVTPNAWRKRPHGSRDIEARLLGVYRLFSPEPVWSTGLSHWWCDTFAARTGQWEEGNGEPESLIRLLETVDPDAVEDFPRAIEGAKAVLRSDQALVQSYEWLIELRDVVPGTFSVREWADVVDDFARWLEAELLSEVEDMSTEEELSAVERVAERLGIEIDQGDLEEASETLSENIAAREAEIDPDSEPDTDPVVLDYQAENQEIEAIFVGLAEYQLATSIPSGSGKTSHARWPTPLESSPMSGHSKWSSIKHKKGVADAKRGLLFTKLARAIQVAAREGGGDPAGNAALATAVQKARDASMPKDNIERAIAKGAGNDADADPFESVVYEGYAAGGRRRARGGAERQPQPHGLRGAPPVLPPRRGARRAGLGGLELRQEGRRARRRRAPRRGRPDRRHRCREDLTRDENVWEIVTAPGDLQVVPDALAEV
jgi:hypothetical protein